MKTYCYDNNIVEVSATNVVNFLLMLYENNNSYSVIKTAKSAISHIVCLPPFPSIGEHPLIIKFMKGVFNLRPPKTKTGFIWDVSILFDFSNEETSMTNSASMSLPAKHCVFYCCSMVLNGVNTQPSIFK